MSECHASHSGSSDDTGTLSFFQYDQKCAVMTRVMIHHKTFFTSDACLAWQTMAMKSECVDVRFAGHAPLNRSEREKKKRASRDAYEGPNPPSHERFYSSGFSCLLFFSFSSLCTPYRVHLFTFASDARTQTHVRAHQLPAPLNFYQIRWPHWSPIGSIPFRS